MLRRISTSASVVDSVQRVLFIDQSELYSIAKRDRILAYAARRPWWSVLQRTLGQMLLLILVSCIGLIPLDPVQSGFRGKNLTLIIIPMIVYAIGTALGVVRIRSFCPATAITGRQWIGLQLLFVLVSCACLAMAAQLIFPVPFAFVISVIPVTPVLFVLIWRLEDPSQRLGLTRPLSSLGFSILGIVLHEAVAILYTNAQNHPYLQPLAALGLPAIRLLLRYGHMKLMKDSREGLGSVTAAFEVEMFNSLYIAIFLHGSSSWITTMILMSVDTIENCVFLYSIITKCHQVRGETDQEQKSELARRLLFQTEFVGLVELVEIVTPLCYMIVMYIIRAGPNAEYFPYVRNVSWEAFHLSQRNVTMLVLLQLSSFITLVFVLHCKFKLPLLAQLASDLDEYATTLNLTFLTFFLLACIVLPLDHLGSDYTLKFDYDSHH